MNFYKKTALVTLLITIVYGYAQYKKIEIDSNRSNIILKNIPAFTATDFFDKQRLVNNSLIKNYKKIYFHFWGTWCGPCAVELPSLLRFAARDKESSALFILFAVNDKRKDILKLLKKMPPLPSNIVVATDINSSIMRSFGTIKVPETYLVDSKGRIQRKFIGAQEWK